MKKEKQLICSYFFEEDFKMAQMYFEKGFYEEAANILHEWLDIENRNLDFDKLYTLYGLCMLYLKNIESAKFYFDLVLDFDEDNIKVRLALAQISLLENRMEDFYQKTIEALLKSYKREDIILGYDTLLTYCMISNLKEESLICVCLRYSFDEDIERAKDDIAFILNQDWDADQDIEIPIVPTVSMMEKLERLKILYFIPDFLFQQSILLEMALYSLKITGEDEGDVVNMLKIATVYKKGNDYFTRAEDESFESVQISSDCLKIHFNKEMKLEFILDLENEKIIWAEKKNAYSVLIN